MEHSKKQIIIIGCPRSGTTYLMRLLASNKAFSWVSNELNKNPFDYHFTKGLKYYKVPIIGKKLYYKAKLFDNPLLVPVEPWNFWNSHINYFQWKPSHFFTPRNAEPSDLTQDQIDKTRNAIDLICKYGKSDIFLSKYTDFPRVKMLKEIFPNAKFIHIIRDGRAVANSYIKKIQSGDFNTSKEIENWVSAWPSKWKDDFIALKQNPIAFTLIQWKYFVSEIRNELSQIPNFDYKEIRYSNLTSNMEQVVKEIHEFVGIKLDSNIKYFMKMKPSDNMNHKWKNNLSQEEKEIFNVLLNEDEFKSLLD
jgi:LPS sulfotransferase NodH